MAGKTGELGRELDFPQAEWSVQDNDGYAEPLTVPGFVNVATTDGIKTIAVRDSRFRPRDARTKDGFYENDATNLVDGVRDLHSNPPALENQKGIEIELNIVNKDDGTPFNLWPDGKPIPGGPPYPPELLNNTYEIAGDPEDDIVLAFRGAFRVVKAASDHMDSHDALVDPASGLDGWHSKPAKYNS